MTSLESDKCPKDGCHMTVTGVSIEELAQVMSLHMDLNHRESFENTALGRLPIEILLKILRYVIPDSKKCFQQRSILKLGTVCKKFNELIKVSDLYREINLSGECECCPLPSKKVFEDLMDSSGSKLRRIKLNFEGRDLLFSAVLKCGNVLQEIHVEHDVDKWSPLTVAANMLYEISRLNPKALISIRFKAITFALVPRIRNEPFFSRIHEMSVNWNKRVLRDCVGRGTKVDHMTGIVLEISGNKIFHHLNNIETSFHANALLHIQGLKRAIVTYPMPNDAQLDDQTETLINKKLEGHPAKLRCSMYKNEEGKKLFEFIMERKSDLQQDPEAAFYTFLEKMRDCCS